MKILNLTQHPASPEQVEAGVVEPAPEVKAQVKELLTFVGYPSPEVVQDRATALVAVVEEQGFEAAMIGGAPFFMAPLENTLSACGILPCYAFSERVSEEVTQADGSVQKVSRFKHVDFYWPPA